MRIVRTYIKENTLYILLENDDVINKVYLDRISKDLSNVDDYENIEHDITLDNQTPINQYITIALPKNNDHAYVVTVVKGRKSAQKLAYDSKHVYDLQRGLLDTNCSTCADKALKQRVFICVFRTQLFEHSYKLEILPDSINNYKDLIRVLEPNFIVK